MTEFEMVVGLECHVQLATASKLFCSCSTGSFGAEPNANVCPVCTGQPGTLPVLNRKAVELGFKAALALGCTLRDVSIFARKNYFYPDLPKGYQISQYELPFSDHGRLDIPGPPAKTIGIHRIHLEEDAGKLLHLAGSRALDHSLADYNRAGTPLIEIVSEPDLRTSEEASQYLTTLKAILQYVGVSSCDMEKGELRCDANVSVRRHGEDTLGTRAEIKNLNSFKNVRDALEHEFGRQVALIKEGGRVVQETRLWDAGRGATFAMRSKEEAHDYRYFPEPDLVPLRADPDLIERLKAETPELPLMRRARLVSQYGLSDDAAGVLTAERALADYYESAVAVCGPKAAKAAANWLGTELLGRLHADKKTIVDSPVPPGHLGELAALIEEGTLSSRLAKEVFAKMWETRVSPKELVETQGMTQVSDESQVAQWVEAAMADNPQSVADLRAGKEQAIGRIVGGVMKRSGGKANPAVVQKLIRERL
ncbi:MAG: Asp-tRNA(Asn)/Glu-tRNA(Gln) amidotransferase subunit GatB [Elusimicrobia bacterium]|nr:Asp-tRNA(Asn)/Glu-tRNA(Gln) amidotransferase subunit GatB [Elusimicrobiota bacterium]